MNDTLTKRDIPEKLEEMRPHPLDDEYRKPAAGGCWICYTGNGWEETEEFTFNMDFDTFVHIDCLEKFDVESVLEFENFIREYNEEIE